MRINDNELHAVITKYTADGAEVAGYIDALELPPFAVESVIVHEWMEWIIKKQLEPLLELIPNPGR